MNRRENSKTFKKVDLKKLEKVAKKFNTYSEFSEAIGHAPGHYQNIKASGTISTSDWLLIKAMFNVDVELQENLPVINDNGEDADALKRKISANNVLIKDAMGEIAKMKSEIILIKEQNKEIAISLNKIGNLLAQINEKIVFNNKEKNDDGRKG